MNSITVVINYAQQNKIYNIEVMPDTIVQELITEFNSMLQINNRQKISLYFNGSILKENKTFKEQNIFKGANIDLKVETIGGNLKNKIKSQ